MEKVEITKTVTPGGHVSIRKEGCPAGRKVCWNDKGYRCKWYRHSILIAKNLAYCHYEEEPK